MGTCHFLYRMVWAQLSRDNLYCGVLEHRFVASLCVVWCFWDLLVPQRANGNSICCTEFWNHCPWNWERFVSHDSAARITTSWRDTDGISLPTTSKSFMCRVLESLLWQKTCETQKSKNYFAPFLTPNLCLFKVWTVLTWAYILFEGDVPKTFRPALPYLLSVYGLVFAVVHWFGRFVIFFQVGAFFCDFSLSLLLTFGTGAFCLIRHSLPRATDGACQKWQGPIFHFFLQVLHTIACCWGGLVSENRGLSS